MNPHLPVPDEVFDALGDKIVAGLGDAVEDARDDLLEFRTIVPHLATMSSRGLANWIHDRIFVHAQARLDSIEGVSFIDSGPYHDMWVGTDYHLRFKRHSKTGAVRAYPTQAALDFITQDDVLFGGGVVNLIAGYEWLDDVQEMGDAVISLRDGSFEDALWVAHLPGTDEMGGGGSNVTPITPIDDSPATPVIDVPKIDEAAKAEETDGP